MKILVTGSSGMLAHDLIPILAQKHDVVGYDRDLLDICNIQNIRSVFAKEKFDLVINCAAYTDVEKAEDEGRLLNYQVNTLGVYNLGKVCEEFGMDCIHISTDYVFDGTKKEGYLPSDKPNPINQYGMAKYLGEELLKQECKNAIIVRTSWLYGGGKQLMVHQQNNSKINMKNYGVGDHISFNQKSKKIFEERYKNFVNTMLKLADTKKELNIIGDQFGNPTYTKDLSNAIFGIIGDINNYRGNIIHATNQTKGNGISWYDFAKEIFSIYGIDIKLKKCDSNEFVTKALRPKYSKLIDHYNLKIRDWKDGLNEYLGSLNN